MILELCKGVHCVDLDESFQTHIYLQNLASIQPRTSPVKLDAPELLEGHRVHRRPAAGTRALGASPSALRSEVNNSLIIVNFFHKIQNFRQISDLFSQI